MIVINEIYKNYDRAARFIESCENNFKRTVEKVSESILNSEGVRIVTLCGPVLHFFIFRGIRQHCDVGRLVGAPASAAGVQAA